MPAPADLDLLVHLDPAAGPRRAQLEEQLREAVRSGRLSSGVALPSTRALARELGVSRGVVVDAYAQLVAEGYLRASQGAPTRVADTAVAAPGSASRQPEPRPPRFDFRPGAPDVSLFPRNAWLASLRRALQEAPDVRLDYGDPRGAPELRTALARYLGRVRGVAADPGLIVVTSGMAQGMALVGRVLAERGERRMGVEDPSSGSGRAQLASTGLTPLAVPVDEEGVRVDLAAGRDLDALMVTPAHQFPLGAVLSPSRRSELVDWATRTGALVLEDDYDAEYRYDRQPVGAVQGLAPEHVVYAGSVSKTLAPGLRLGWLVVPERIAPDVIAAKQRDDLGTPVVEQLALADFLERGELDRHLRRTRVVYRARRDALVAALREHLPGCEPTGVAAGLHLLAPLPEGTDEATVLDGLRAAGVGLYGLSEHAIGPAPPALLLGYGRIGEASIGAGVEQIARGVGGSRQPCPRRRARR